MNNIFIISEAGCNHNGSLKIANELIREAKLCGSDAIKFQSFHTEDLIRRDIKRQTHLTNIKGKSIFKITKKLEFSKRDYIALKNTAHKENIIIFVSVFDIRSLQLIERLDFPIIKIPSGEIVNLELLTAVSKLGKPIILSTGMSTMQEIERAVKIISSNLNLKCVDKKLINKFPFFEKGLVLMHTVSKYPSPPAELNLKAINTLKTAFDLPVGYSDHSNGDLACLIAVALGAEIIEKHFTFDKNMVGPDHGSSIEPSQWKNLIKKIKNVEKMLGNGDKRPSLGEKGMLLLFRRAIVAKRNIRIGEIIKRNMLEIKRPFDGIGCERMNEVLGLKAAKYIKMGYSIRWEDLL